MANIQVAIINASTVLQDSQVQAVVPALETQVHQSRNSSQLLFLSLQLNMVMSIP